nr:MAG TPA: carbonic anhydrase [Caudoviricetes sp.]
MVTVSTYFFLYNGRFCLPKCTQGITLLIN